MTITITAEPPAIRSDAPASTQDPRGSRAPAAVPLRSPSTSATPPPTTAPPPEELRERASAYPARWRIPTDPPLV